MSKQELKFCNICGEAILAYKSRKKLYCSAACSQKSKRIRHNEKFEELEKGGNVPEQTKQIVETSNSEVKKIVIPIIPTLGSFTGKDLSECARPDGKHLYTDTDLWILLAKICKLVFDENSGNLLSVLHTNQRSEQLISDFEKRFKCEFLDAQKANPDIKPFSTDAQNATLVTRYSKLPYSR